MSDNRPGKLNKVDKAAILLLSLGETDAAQVLRHMGPKEVQRVGVAMAAMRNIQREQVEQVMSEFVEVVGDQTSLGVGADGYIRKMLTQALGEDKNAWPVVATALVARLYKILRPTLLQLSWYLRAETWLFDFRDRVYGFVRALPAWQVAANAIRRAKAWLVELVSGVTSR